MCYHGAGGAEYIGMNWDKRKQIINNRTNTCWNDDGGLSVLCSPGRRGYWGWEILRQSWSMSLSKGLWRFWTNGDSPRRKAGGRDGLCTC